MEVENVKNDTPFLFHCDFIFMHTLTCLHCTGRPATATVCVLELWRQTVCVSGVHRHRIVPDACASYVHRVILEVILSL